MLVHVDTIQEDTSDFYEIQCSTISEDDEYGVYNINIESPEIAEIVAKLLMDKSNIINGHIDVNMIMMKLLQAHIDISKEDLEKINLAFKFYDDNDYTNGVAFYIAFNDIENELYKEYADNDLILVDYINRLDKDVFEKLKSIHDVIYNFERTLYANEKFYNVNHILHYMGNGIFECEVQ